MSALECDYCGVTRGLAKMKLKRGSIVRYELERNLNIVHGSR